MGFIKNKGRSENDWKKIVMEIFLMFLSGLGAYWARLYFWLGLESPCLSGLREYLLGTEGEIN